MHFIAFVCGISFICMLECEYHRKDKTNFLGAFIRLEKMQRNLNPLRISGFGLHNSNFMLITFTNAALFSKQSCDATDIVCSADTVFEFWVFVSQDLDYSVTSNSVFCLAYIT